MSHALILTLTLIRMLASTHTYESAYESRTLVSQARSLADVQVQNGYMYEYVSISISISIRIRI